jgi:hypothetical protein
MDVLTGLLGDLRTHRRFSPLELILVLPALALALWSLGTWSVYYWLGQEAQSGADLALAAIRTAPAHADLEALARAAAAHAIHAPVSDVLVERETGRLAVRLVYDVSANPVFAAPALTPLPPTVIVRSAASR